MNQTDASGAPPASRIGWTYPSRPSVVSGESASRGRAATTSASSLTAFTSRALRRPRVDADALDREPELVRGERLDLELAEPRPVERVGEVGAEGVEVEVVGALADLLVDRERDARGGARRVVVEEVRDRRHDHRDARLVVRAEERRAVARDQVLPDPLGEGGHVGGVEHLRLVARAAGSARPTRRGGRSGGRPCPGVSGVVSTCAMSPTVGAPSTVPGSVAKT